MTLRLDSLLLVEMQPWVATIVAELPTLGSAVDGKGRYGLGQYECTNPSGH